MAKQTRPTITFDPMTGDFTCGNDRIRKIDYTLILPEREAKELKRLAKWAGRAARMFSRWASWLQAGKEVGQ